MKGRKWDNYCSIIDKMHFYKKILRVFSLANPAPLVAVHARPDQVPGVPRMATPAPPPLAHSSTFLYHRPRPQVEKPRLKETELLAQGHTLVNDRTHHPFP